MVSTIIYESVDVFYYDYLTCHIIVFFIILVSSIYRLYKIRLATGCLRIIANRRDQPIPKQLKKSILVSPKTKWICLNDWSTNNLHAPLLEDMELYVTYDDKAYCITSRQGHLTIASVPELESKQEEADTKMLSPPPLSQ